MSPPVALREAGSPASVKLPVSTSPEVGDRAASQGAETIAELSTRLVQVERERDQYKQGLEAAVAELNRLDRENKVARKVAEIALTLPATTAPASGAETTRQWGKWAARVSSLRAPTVQVLGQEILVTGMLYNSGNEDGSVAATVVLLLDNRQIDAATISLMVPARSEASYSQKFRFPGNAGTYSATVSWD